MAQRSSNFLRNIVLGIIIVLLIVAMSIMGFTDVFQPKAAGSVALVGDTKITIRQYKNDFDRRLRLYNQENGTNLTAGEAYERGFNDQIVSSLVTEAVMDLDADELNIGVAKTVARNALSEYDIFKDEITGEFSEDKVTEFFRGNRDFNRNDFEASTLRDLRRQQVTRPLVSGIKAPLSYAQQRYKFITEQRQVKILTLSRDSVPAPETPSDDVLKAFISENEADYTQPEYRRFTILRIENFDIIPDVLTGDAPVKIDGDEDASNPSEDNIVRISEKDIVETYEADLADGKLGTLESRSLTYLPVTNETLASDVMARLASGESFADAALAVGVSAPIIYNEVRPETIADPRVATAIFAAEAGEIISGEGTLGGSYVARLNGITPAEKPDLENERDRIVAELTKDTAEAELFDRFGKLQDLIDNGASFEDAAKESGVSASSIDYISRLGATKDGLRLSGIGTLTGVGGDEEILRELFTAEPGFPTEFFETSTGGYAMIRVDDVLDAKVRPFEDVKARASAIWTAQQTDEKLSDLAQNLATRLRSDESIDDVAASVEAGGSLETRMLVRTTRSPGLSDEVLSQLLEAREGEVVQGYGTDSLTRSIAIVTKVTANADSLSAGFADAMQTQSSEELSSDIQTAYRQNILSENPAQTFEQRMREVNGLTE